MSKSVEEILSDKLDYAKTVLFLEVPFFASLMYSFKFRIDDSKKVGMWVNNNTLCFNSDFVKKTKKRMFASYILKTLMHFIYSHKERSEQMYNKKIKFSLAANYETNNLLHNEICSKTDLNNFLEFDLDNFPIGNDFSEMSAEQIFSKLPDIDDGELLSMLMNVSFDVESLEGIDEETKNMLSIAASILASSNVMDQLNKDLMIQSAYNSSKQYGKTPGFVERMVGDFQNKSRVNWKTVIKSIVQKIPIDWDFAERDRRFVTSKFILPSLTGNKANVLIAYDTSGSMSEDELKVSLNETFSILKQFQSISMDLICFDTEATKPEKIETMSQLLKYKMIGGGGSDVRPVFEYINKHKNKYDAIIIFTDGCVEYPNKPYTRNLLWVLTGDYVTEPPFGKFVKYKN